MKVIRNFQTFNNDSPISAALGFFDGMHLGHQAIINNSHIDGYKKGIVMFEDLPSDIGKSKLRLMRIDDRLEFLEQSNTDIIFLLDFNLFRSVSKEEFIFNYIKNAGIKYVVAGFNYTFGFMGQGTTYDLEDLCARSGIHAKVIAPVCIDEERVSSSAIREFLMGGDVEKAAKMLGRPYQIAVFIDQKHKNIFNSDKYFTFDACSHDIILPKQGEYDIYISYCNNIHKARAIITGNRKINFILPNNFNTSFNEYKISFIAELG